MDQPEPTAPALPKRRFRTVRRVAVPLVLVIIAAALPSLLPGVATVAPNVEQYAAPQAWTDCPNYSGGQYDEQRRLYIACGTSVRIQQADGSWSSKALGPVTYDVAPSPDGSVLYGTAGGPVKRYTRNADGAYTADLTWKLPTISANGSEFTTAATSIATDGFGYLYVSHGSASPTNPADNVVTKHAPDGTQLAWFGGYTATGEPGRFNLNKGLAPTRDGRFVYVAEKTGGRMQRFDYQPDGSYRLAKAWGKTDTNCSTTGNFAAPGDVAVDAWGFVYVMDTSCRRVQKFTADGTFVWSKSTKGQAPVTDGKSHWFAVDWRGSVYVPEISQIKLIRENAPSASLPAIQPLAKPAYAASSSALCTSGAWSHGAGQAAVDGTMYVACGDSIAVTEPPLTSVKRIALPAGPRYYDVAPSPDERYLYVARRVATQGRAELVRFARSGAAGSTSYTLDSSWKPASLMYGNKSWLPQGQYVATDAWGDIYYSIGGWAGYYSGAFDGAFTEEPSPTLIVKYDPAGAIKTFITRSDGDFDVNMGVAVSRDGRTVWAIEQKAGVTSRAQRFDYTRTGAYRATAAIASFGSYDVLCSAAKGMRLPYDIGVDPWGDVWIADTGCSRAEVYAPNGERKAAVQLPGRIHGIAVDLHGAAWLGAVNLRIARTSAVPGPVPTLKPLETPDTEAPILTAITIPNDGVVTTQTFDLGLPGTDANRITGVRFAGDDGIWGAWRPYTATISFTTTPGSGPKFVAVQLRDEFEHESEPAWRRFELRLPGDQTATLDDSSSAFVPPVNTGKPIAVAVPTSVPPATCRAKLTSKRVVRLSGCPKSAKVQQLVGGRWVTTRTGQIRNFAGRDRWRVIVGTRVRAVGTVA